MAALSDYLENKLIDHLLRMTTFSKPSVIAIALCTEEPTEASTGATIAEVANSNNYSRKTLNPSDSNWLATQGGTSGASSGTGGSISNAVAIEFDMATESWGTITHFAVCDSATWGAGNVLFYGELASPTLVSGSKGVTIGVGELTLTVGPCPSVEGMSAFSNYLENKLVDHLLRTATFSQPSVIAIALCTAAPTEASTGATIAEVANSNGYTRKTLNPSDSNWTATQGGTSGVSSGIDGYTINAVDINFDEATGSWGTVTHIAVCDSAAWGAGNVLFYGELASPTLVGNGDTVTIDAGNLTLAIGFCPAESSYNCVSGDCVDPGDGTGEFATLEDCQAVCVSSMNCNTAVRMGLRIVWNYVNAFGGGGESGTSEEFIEIIPPYTSTSVETDPLPSNQSGIIPGHGHVPDETWSIEFDGLAFTLSTSFSGGSILTFGTPERTLYGGYPTCIYGVSPFAGPPQFQQTKTTTLPGFFHYYSASAGFWI